MSVLKPTKDQPPIFFVAQNEIGETPIALDRPLPQQWLNTLFSRCEYQVTPIEGHGRIQVSSVSDGILVQGKASCRAETDCSTCLRKVILDLSVDLTTFMTPANRMSKAELEEFTPEDLVEEYIEGETLVLDELVCDGLLLELPMTPRCLGECQPIKHLVTARQAELSKKNIDPRLAPLADITLSKES